MLNGPMLHPELIGALGRAGHSSKILIGEVKKVDGQKVQKVRIVYNFVGEIPEIAA